MQCDPGQLLHFLIPSFSIEEPFRTTCLDSLTIDRSLYGAKKTICGGLSSIDSDREDFNDGRLYVEFSTNRVINDDGFYIAVTCVRPQFYNIPPPESVAAGEEEAQQRDRRGTRNSIEVCERGGENNLVFLITWKVVYSSLLYAYCKTLRLK